MTHTHDPELLALADSYADLLKAARRLTVLRERLLHHARSQLTVQCADDAQRELAT